jgi:hypothetical protein
VSLIQVEGTLEAINKVRVLPKVKIFLSTVDDAGAGRYRISAEAPETMFAEIRESGCEVVVAMSAQDIDRFHGEVTAALTPPEDTQGHHNGPRSGPET